MNQGHARASLKIRELVVVTASGLLSPAKNPCNPNNLGCNADKYEPMSTIWDVVLSNSDQSCHALRLLGGLQNLVDIGQIREGWCWLGKRLNQNFLLWN